MTDYVDEEDYKSDEYDSESCDYDEEYEDAPSDVSKDPDDDQEYLEEEDELGEEEEDENIDFFALEREKILLEIQGVNNADTGKVEDSLLEDEEFPEEPHYYGEEEEQKQKKHRKQKKSRHRKEPLEDVKFNEIEHHNDHEEYANVIESDPHLHQTKKDNEDPQQHESKNLNGKKSRIPEMRRSTISLSSSAVCLKPKGSSSKIVVEEEEFFEVSTNETSVSLDIDITSNTPTSFNSDECALHLNLIPRRASKASEYNHTSKSLVRKNMSFSNERLREIDRHNQILLKKILTQKPTYENPFGKKKSCSSLSSKSSSVELGSRTTSAAINRKNKQKEIDRQNQILKQKIEAIARKSKQRKGI